MKIGVILGSTRDTRKGILVANYIVKELQNKDQNNQYELVDLKDYNLSHYNEPSSPRSSSDYKYKETIYWSKKIRSLDGFIFVTPEYNGYFTGALKDAIDYLYYEWEGKPYGIVGYGSRGAKRAVAQLHNLLASFKMKRVSEDIGINQVWNAFTEETLNEEYLEGDILKMINELK